MCVQLIRNQDYITDFFHHLGNKRTVSVCLKSKIGKEFNTNMSITYKKDGCIELAIATNGFIIDDDKYMCYVLWGKGCQELFSFDIHILDMGEGGFCTVKLPDNVALHLDRKFSRFKAFEDNENPKIYIPLFEKTFKIIDISPMGLSFKANRKIFPVGSIVKNVIIDISKNLKATVNAQIKYVTSLGTENYVYGVYFSHIHHEDRAKIFEYIFERCYDAIEYVNSSIGVAEDVKKGVNNDILNNWILQNKQLLNHSNCSSELILGIINKKRIFHDIYDMEVARKIYSNTFLYSVEQKSEDEDPNIITKIDTLVSLAEVLLNSISFSYCISYLPITNELSELFLNINEYIENKENFAITRLETFSCLTNDVLATLSAVRSAFVCEELHGNDKKTFLNHCKDKLTPLEINAYDYTFQKFNLSNVKKAYKPYEIIERKLWRILDSTGICLAYAVAENSVEATANMCRIYPIHHDINKEELLKSLLTCMGTFFKEYNKKHFYIHIDSGNNLADTKILSSNINGMMYKGIYIRPIMNYKGLIAFKKFMIGAPVRHIKYYPLTYPQKSIWNIEKVYPGTTFGNMAATIRIRENVDFNLLEQAINLVVKLNDSMRIRIIEKEKTVFQYISKYAYEHFDFKDFCNQNIEALYKWDEKEQSTPFNIASSKLFYICLLKINNEEYGFFIKMHHIICDAWTMFSLVIRRILEYYELFKNNTINIIPTSSPSYLEYILGEQTYLHSEQFAKNKQFWINKFSTMPELMLSKPSLKIKDVQSLISSRKTFKISTKVSSDIKEFCKVLNVSEFSFFLSIIAMYLNRMTSKKNIAVGSSIRNRTTNEKEIIGMFVNTIPMRVNVKAEANINECIKSIGSLATEFLEHKKFPYELIQKDVRAINNVHHDMFDVCFSYQSAPVFNQEMPSNISIRWHSMGIHQIQPLIIHISDRDNQGSYLVNLDYLVNTFSALEIEQMQKHLQLILENVPYNGEKKVKDLEFLSDNEKKKLLYDFNNTTSRYEKKKTIHQLFQEQALKTPHNIAIICDNCKITYKELDERSDWLAKKLIKKGVMPENIVGIILERSIDMIVAMIGVLKSGAAYLPIDIETPKDRSDFMLKDSKVSVVITQIEGSNVYLNLDTIVINNNEPCINNCEELIALSDPHNLAYVIYTSGTGGEPKGVMIEHRSVVNLCTWHINMFKINQGHKVAQYLGYEFDAFVQGMFPYLISGCEIHILKNDVRLNVDLLCRYIQNNNISIITLPTKVYEQIASIDIHLPALKKVFIGGEKLINFKQSNYEVINNYGPTENCVVTTSMVVDKLYDNIPIGKPIANNKIYILDPYLNLVPIGTEGELYMSGDGLARGYLNNPKLTAENFIDNPFFKGEKMYKTGDLAKWLPDGNIEFIDRVDRQLKIRGFRIEPEEIERKLMNYINVEQAVVLAIETGRGSTNLVGYVVMNCAENNGVVNNLKRYLSDKLPHYMIPSKIIKIGQVPLTRNGKVDRESLINMYYTNECHVNYVEPKDNLQKTLIDIWKTELGVDCIGIMDDYFEIGGDSLKAISVIYKIQQVLGVELTFSDILKNSSILQLSEHLTEKMYETKQRLIVSPEVTEFYTVSSAQKGMYLLIQTETQSINYNMPISFMIEGDVVIGEMERALKAIIQRHEILRTRFLISSSGIVQEILDDVDFSIRYMDTYSKNDVDYFIRPFDLNIPPLIRITIMRLNQNLHLMMIDMHHIISDEVSINVIFKELQNIYENRDLPLLSRQYKDFSEQQRILLDSNKLMKQREFWLKAFETPPPSLDMTLDYSRPSNQSFEGNRIKFEIDEIATEQIELLCKKLKVTLFIILLAIYKILLHRYTEQEDITVGIPVTCRDHADFRNLVGLFVNTLPIRSYPQSEKIFTDFILEVKENCMGAFENKDYPFDRIVEDLNIQSDSSRNPLFDTMFVLNTTDIDVMNIGNLKLTREDVNFNVAKFDITLSAIKKGEKIFFEFEYCTRLFKAETIEGLKECFIVLLKDCINNPNKKLMELELLSEREKNKILYEFNDTDCEYPKDKTLHQLFEEQVEITPENIALVFQDKQVTYRELNNRANQLAHVLRSKGVRSNDIVGLLVERSVEMIVGILGILKSGGAYLPIDVNLPYERIRYLIEDSQMKVLVTRESLLGNNDEKLSILVENCVILLNSIYDKHSIANPPLVNTPLDLAYVIYTSGTTGNPKGVMVEHKGVVNFTKYHIKTHNIISKSVLLQLMSFSFDGFGTSFYCSIMTGAKMVILDDMENMNYDFVKYVIKLYGVSHITVIPSIYKEIILNASTDDVKSLKVVDLVGDKANKELIKMSTKKNENVLLINEYGPTEASIGCTSFLGITKETCNIIGKPIDNTKIYILDKHKNLLPVGAVGELYISGTGVSQGYLNNESLTKTKFPEDVFAQNGRMYKTGDLGKWLSDGNIKFLGRVDKQIKINGVRIELQEIEYYILKYAHICNAIVTGIMNELGTYQWICAYYVADKEININELKVFLADRLPRYMIPSYFIKLDKIPLNSNGKIRLDSLPAPTITKKSCDRNKLPRNDIDNNLLNIFTKVLNNNTLSIDDNFFECGGDSITAMKIVSCAYKDKLNITVLDIYKYPTVRTISDKLQDRSNDSKNI